MLIVCPRSWLHVPVNCAHDLELCSCLLTSLLTALMDAGLTAIDKGTNRMEVAIEKHSWLA